MNDEERPVLIYPTWGIADPKILYITEERATRLADLYPRIIHAFVDISMDV